MTCIITTYKSNSANAFLNLWNEKRLQFLIATPSALIPAQMLNANIITNAYINPAVEVRYANNGLAVVANIIRHCSQLKILSISSINKELRGGGKPPPFWLLLYNLAQHKFRAVVNRRGCSVDNVTFLHNLNFLKLHKLKHAPMNCQYNLHFPGAHNLRTIVGLLILLL